MKKTILAMIVASVSIGPFAAAHAGEFEGSRLQVSEDLSLYYETREGFDSDCVCTGLVNVLHSLRAAARSFRQFGPISFLLL